MIAQHAAQHHDHDNGCGHIVEHCGKEKRNQREYPHETPFVGCMNPVDQDLESAITVNQLYYCHCTDQEYDDFASVAQGFYHLGRDIGVMTA